LQVIARCHTIASPMEMAPRKLDRVLIVEDNTSLRSAIATLVREWGAVACEAGNAREALAAFDPPPDLVICDIALPDDSGLSVLEATLSLRPEPAKIAISGVATAEEAFCLGQLGVREYLAKPFSLSDLGAAVRRVLTEVPDLDPLIRASVGQVPMRELQQHVRDLMVDEAMALTFGSRRAAARLLDISRQAVQQIVRQREADGSVPPARDD
jgi:DNA-binding response OmpR family regulator